MSALQISQRKISPKLDLYEGTRACDICHGGSARFEVMILDYPAGLVCKSCQKKWRELWEGALV